MIFENSQIDIQQLPTIEDIDYQRLAPAYLKVKYISSAIFFALMLALIFYIRTYPFVSEHPTLANGLLGLWAVWALANLLLVKATYNVEGYALREKDIVHVKGLITRRQTALPFNRVQHCEIKAGPIQRYFKLKSLEVYTAGGSSSDLRINGLAGDDAQRLKKFIIQTTGQKKVDNQTEGTDQTEFVSPPPAEESAYMTQLDEHSPQIRSDEEE